MPKNGHLPWGKVCWFFTMSVNVYNTYRRLDTLKRSSFYHQTRIAHTVVQWSSTHVLLHGSKMLTGGSVAVQAGFTSEI